MKQFEHKSYYINRELSWLAFNERVMAQASRVEHPILERLKFMSIVASNLDEFFMVRVAGLKDQVKIGYNRPENKTQMTPQQQLDEISHKVHAEVKKQYRILTKSIIPALRKEGISFVRPQRLSKQQQSYLNRYYNEHIFPVLTPLAIDASHPFPMLANRSLNIAILLEPEDEDFHPVRVSAPEPDEDKVQGTSMVVDRSTLFAVVQVPSVLPRFIELPQQNRSQRTYVLLEHVIQQHIDILFPGSRVVEAACFRITRNSDINVDEERAEDLLEEIEKELKKRKRGVAVRLEVEYSMSDELVETLRDWLDLETNDIYSIRGPLDTTFFSKFYSLPYFDHLRYEQIVPQAPRDLFGENDIFGAIARKDILVFHPYESFDPVVHFVNHSADDPQVLAIKQTLYRVSGNSPVVSALTRAAENGKQVTVVVELKARFDEENNIVWAKRLEEAGCHVIYGLVGLKTHSKITLVVRKEGQDLKRFVHLSTGNYNDTTATMYTDIGMFTSDEDIGYDASAFFNHLTGISTTPKWRKIATAPHGMRERFIELIESEIQKSTPENPGRIIAKMNSLTEKDLILALFRASTAGVQIDLICRGICCLRPGIPGVSEHIRVHSIVGRFLEHSRVFYFQNGGDDKLYLSSADWMTRNMGHRVEILFPVSQDNLRRRLKDILQAQLCDNVNRYVLQANGHYEKVPIAPDDTQFSSQMYFYEQAVAHADFSSKALLEHMTPKTTPR